MESEKQKTEMIKINDARQVTFIILTLLQLSEDLCVSNFNNKRIKQLQWRKADMLLTYDAFNTIRKDLSRNMDKDKFSALMDLYADAADKCESQVNLIKNAFLEECFKFYAYEDCDFLSTHLTAIIILHTANNIFIKWKGQSNKRIISILKSLDNFGKTINARALNKDCDINSNKALDLVMNLFMKLLEITKIDD